MDNFVLLTNRALEPIDRILNCVLNLVYTFFRNSDQGYAKMVVNTIINNSYLLVGLSLLIVGFVIGILKRLISM